MDKFVELPALSLSLTPFLGVPYLSLTLYGLPRPHKGTETDTIFDFSHHPLTTRKLFRSLYSSLTSLLGVPYPPLGIP